MTDTEDPGHEEVGQLIADALSWAENQPWALTPEQVRAGKDHRGLLRGGRRGLGFPVVGLAAAALVVVVVVAVLVTGSSPPSSAQVRQKIAAAEALSLKAGTIRVDQTVKTTGGPVVRYHKVILPAARVSRLSYFVPFVSTQLGGGGPFYVTEVDNASTGYMRMTSSRTVPTATPGWVSFPLGTITNPAPIPPGSPGGIGGDVGPITHLGTKTIGGVKVTGYGVTVSVRALIAEAKTETARDIYRNAYLAYGITRFPAQIWLDSSGHVRELHWTIHPKFNGTKASTELFSYSKAVATVSFPPPSDVTPTANQRAAYDQALNNAIEGESG